MQLLCVHSTLYTMYAQVDVRLYETKLSKCTLDTILLNSMRMFYAFAVSDNDCFVESVAF